MSRRVGPAQGVDGQQRAGLAQRRRTRRDRDRCARRARRGCASWPPCPTGRRGPAVKMRPSYGAGPRWCRRPQAASLARRGRRGAVIGRRRPRRAELPPVPPPAPLARPARALRCLRTRPSRPAAGPTAVPPLPPPPVPRPASCRRRPPRCPVAGAPAGRRCRPNRCGQIPAAHAGQQGGLGRPDAEAGHARELSPPSAADPGQRQQRRPSQRQRGARSNATGAPPAGRAGRRGRWPATPPGHTQM